MTKEVELRAHIILAIMNGPTRVLTGGNPPAVASSVVINVASNPDTTVPQYQEPVARNEIWATDNHHNFLACTGGLGVDPEKLCRGTTQETIVRYT
jgi:hypothetical protein